MNPVTFRSGTPPAMHGMGQLLLPRERFGR